jgi:hypothetical protein
MHDRTSREKKDRILFAGDGEWYGVARWRRDRPHGRHRPRRRDRQAGASPPWPAGAARRRTSPPLHKLTKAPQIKLGLAAAAGRAAGQQLTWAWRLAHSSDRSTVGPTATSPAPRAERPSSRKEPSARPPGRHHAQKATSQASSPSPEHPTGGDLPERYV